MFATALLAATLAAPGFYDFTVNDIQGKSTSLKKYEGKVVLVVNVASRCGNTPQYKGLQALYEKYSDQGFVILGFPSNDFGRQEPGSEAEIAEFCTQNYGVTFPMFSKVKVTGEDKHPLFAWLISNSLCTDEVEWNFTKFLVSRDGQVAARYLHNMKPEDTYFVRDIEKQLAKD